MLKLKKDNALYIYSIRNCFRLSFLSLLKTLRRKYAGSPAFAAENQIVLSIFLLVLLTAPSLYSWDFAYLDNESDTLYNGIYQKRQTEGRVSLIDYYKQNVSPLQGSRCPCFPSCSDFTAYSMEKFGVVTGFIMGFERLFIREQGMLFSTKNYDKINRYSTKYHLKSGLYDLPEANNIFIKKEWRTLSADFYNIQQFEIR